MSTDRSARGVRIVAIVMATVFFLLIGAFTLMVFFVHDEARLNAVGPIAPGPGQERGGLVFTGTANIWEVRGRMTLDARRQVRFDFDLIGPTGIPAPDTLEVSVAVDMPIHDMPTIELPLVRTGPGSYAAGAPLPQAGQWRLLITLPEITGVFIFDVDS
ncbi:MAG TPA: AAA family ATPase [Rhodocyclaceae bacterium]|nr:AAA family ATPase [Rhodocyclaceae bacterium]HRQ47078.1 AAA family ATPase [Rhodocyclaceae bacterium]